MTLDELLPYLRHKADCDATMPMWHKGPCECGFAALVVKLRAAGVDVIDGAIYECDPQPPLGEKREYELVDFNRLKAMREVIKRTVKSPRALTDVLTLTTTDVQCEHCFYHWYVGQPEKHHENCTYVLAQTTDQRSE